MFDLFMILVYLGLACIGFMVFMYMCVFMLTILNGILCEVDKFLFEK